MILKAYNQIPVKGRYLELLEEAYYSEVSFLDENLEILIDLIFNKLGYDETLIVIVSDHGEAFGENNIYIHPGYVLLKVLLHVPLSLYGGLAKKIEVDENSLYSSVVVHEIITKVLKGEEKIKIQPSEKVFSFAYKSSKIIKPFHYIYEPVGYAITKLSNGKLDINVKYKEDDQCFSDEIRDYIRILKRGYLAYKLRGVYTEMYRILEKEVRA